jgi:hypothetical protein
VHHWYRWGYGTNSGQRVWWKCDCFHQRIIFERWIVFDWLFERRITIERDCEFHAVVGRHSQDGRDLSRQREGGSV